MFEDSKATVDIGGGLRWFSTDSSLTLKPGLLPRLTATSNKSWVDPIIGLRVTIGGDRRWTGTFEADYGGLRKDSETWSATFWANYKVSDKWLVRAGYRKMSVENTDGSRFKLQRSGPIFGAIYRF